MGILSPPTVKSASEAAETTPLANVNHVLDMSCSIFFNIKKSKNLNLVEETVSRTSEGVQGSDFKEDALSMATLSATS